MKTFFYRLPSFILVSAVLGCLLPARTGFAAPASGPIKPNIVFIMCDDLGWGDLGCNGSNIPTPNVDKLARAGTQLTQYYVAPVCSPTRSGLMTGRYWTRFGVFQPQAVRALPFGTVTMASALKTMGYDTALFGKWHLGSLPEWGPNHFGFDYSYGYFGGGLTPFTHFYKVGPFQHTWHRNDDLITEKGHVTDLIGNEVVKYISGRKGNDTPFLAYVPFSAVHLPIKEPKEWLDKVPEDFAITTDFGKPDSTFPPAGFKGELTRHFAACVMHMDYEVGRIVQAVIDAGKRDNTLIVFTSDNGAPTMVENANQPYPKDDTYPSGPLPGSNLPFRGIKGGVYDGGIHVACVVNWPGHIPVGPLAQLIDVVDWLPTFASLTGYNPEHDLKWDGMNVWPFLTREKPGILRRLLYSASTAGEMVRDGDWKLVALGPPGSGKAKIELYDLSRDPYETADLAAQLPERVQSLRQSLKQISAANNDSLPPDHAEMLKKYGSD